MVQGGEGRRQHTSDLGQPGRGHGALSISNVLGRRGPVEVVLVWFVYGERQSVRHVILEVFTDPGKILDHADVVVT